MINQARQLVQKFLYNFNSSSVNDSQPDPVKNILLIHTPKCGGTYLKHNYKIDAQDNVQDAGHSHLRAHRNVSNSTIVGLIREPLDWYASYYYFCRKSLNEAPQGGKNFPVNHPISILTDNATSTFEQMILNMMDTQFLKVYCQSISNIYARDTRDIFDFMLRTGCGFWTWTMMHHFSRKQTEEMSSREDVNRTCKDILLEVNFIHLETIDQDTNNLLGLKQDAGKSINQSNRPTGECWDHTITEVAEKLDGTAAKLLGGYPLKSRGTGSSK